MSNILQFPPLAERASRVLAELNAAELATDGPLDDWTRAVIHAGSGNRAALHQAKAELLFWSGQALWYERATASWAKRGQAPASLSVDLDQARKSLSAWTRQVEVLEGLVKAERLLTAAE